MPEFAENWEVLAEDFPPTLNREKHRTALEAGESPDAYQCDWDTPGLLAAISSEPTGVAHVAQTATIATDLGGELAAANITGAMKIYYNRHWRVDDVDGQFLRFGAYDYISTLYAAQEQGLISFKSVGGADILDFGPVGQTGMVVVLDSSSTDQGGFLISNASSPSGKFTVAEIDKQVIVKATNLIGFYEDLAYYVNEEGVWSWDGTKITELTAAIRNTLGAFTPQAIRFDLDKRLILGHSTGTDWTIDLATGKLFDYLTTGFRFTSRTLGGGDEEPLSVDRVAFLIDNSSSAGGTIKFQVKINDGDYGTEIELPVVYGNEDTHQRVEYAFEDYADIGMAREWTLRITSLPTNIRIKQIQANVSRVQAQDFAE